jgi:hypothetical protein
VSKCTDRWQDYLTGVKINCQMVTWIHWQQPRSVDSCLDVMEGITMHWQVSKYSWQFSRRLTSVKVYWYVTKSFQSEQVSRFIDRCQRTVHKGRLSRGGQKVCTKFGTRKGERRKTSTEWGGLTFPCKCCKTSFYKQPIMHSDRFSDTLKMSKNLKIFKISWQLSSYWQMSKILENFKHQIQRFSNPENFLTILAFSQQTSPL